MTDTFVTTIYRKKDVAFDKVSGTIGGQIGGQMSTTQQRILDLIIENNKISRNEIAFKIGINESAIQKQLNKLKQKGLLQRIGPDKGGYWKVISKD